MDELSDVLRDRSLGIIEVLDQILVADGLEFLVFQVDVMEDLDSRWVGKSVRSLRYEEYLLFVHIGVCFSDPHIGKTAPPQRLLYHERPQPRDSKTEQRKTLFD